MGICKIWGDIGENIHTCLENYSTSVPLLPALSRQVMKPGYCTEDSNSSQALGCVNLCGLYNVSEENLILARTHRRRLVINIVGQKFGSQILGGQNLGNIYFQTTF